MLVRRWKIIIISAITLVGGCGTTSAPPEIVSPPDGEPGRWIFLAGAKNTRDIGGYETQDGQRVRWKTAFRSGTLSHVVDAGCEAFRDLQILTVIDFRNRVSPSPLFDGDVVCIQQAARVVGLPVSLAKDTGDVPFYVQGVRDHVDSYRGAFELLADPANLPLLYHCSAGKDRSGIMTALLLTLLGVDRETVIEDYLLSNLVFTTGVTRELMEPLLDEVDAQGGIEAYLSNIGVDAATQAAIRANLLEPIPPR